MFRKSTLLLTILGLLLALSFLTGAPRVTASRLNQATPSTEPMHMDTEEGHDDEHGEHGKRIPAGDASIRILAPQDGATFTTDMVAVEVETTNWPLGEGKHWHLYVDGNEQGMSQGNSTTLVAHDLEPGEHEIEVVMSNELHQELDATAAVTIRVEAATTPPASAPGDNSLLLVGGIVVAVLIVAGVGFAVARRK